MGHASEALPDLTTASQLSPRRADIWHQLGQSHELVRDFTGARAAYQKAVDLQPSSADYRNALGFVMVDAGDADRALTQFHAVLQHDPNN